MAKTLKTRERVFLAAGGAALVLYALSTLVILPYWRESKDREELVRKKLETLAAYQGLVSREPALARDDGELEKALRTYRAHFLQSNTPPLAAAELQTRLKEMAGQAGLKIVSEKILSDRQKDSYLEIPVQIVASGALENVRDFMVSLESDEMFISIQEISLRSVKRKQFLPATRTYKEVHEIQATMTVAGLIPVV